MKQNKQKSIGRLISMLHRASAVFFQKEAKQMELSQGQFRILNFIMHHHGSSQNKIQDYFNLDRGTVSVVIKSLEKNGFITRKADEKDKRATCIFPTKKGEETYPAIKEVLNQWNHNLLEGFSPGEKLLAYEFLERMLNNINPIEE
ncbi:MarR family transcriptional regulator [Flammeovirgaceae bacterium SG7u.111]|nr:MarR family transcriptional regulator [Flammeovirgaceae bacterium SG7u.132]WPO38373.1 MarR family transcriptional regulator [Flammeovirgaceae bacterium SG7u.111]